MSLFMEQLSLLSASALVATIQKLGMILLFPGLLASMAFGGNVHAFSLVTAAIFNALIYFCIAWLIFRLIFKLQAKRMELHANS